MIRILLFAAAAVWASIGAVQAACNGLPYALTNGQNADADQVMANFNYVLNCAGNVQPQGRLTLTSGTPVMINNVTTTSTIYYTPYVGNLVPVYDTANVRSIAHTFSELTIGLNSANVAAGSVYDMFIVIDSGTPAGCIGPAWSSSTNRGTGAGTTEVHTATTGYWTNQNTLTNCWGGGSGTTDLGPVAADEGTYVGSFYAVAAGQTAMMFDPAPAVGGTNNVLGVWNAYNRVPVNAVNLELRESWTYNGPTWRRKNNSASNVIHFVDGLGQSFIRARSFIDAISSGGVFGIAITLDAAINPTQTQALSSNTSLLPIVAEFMSPPQIGYHVVNALELSSVPTATFFSQGNQSSLTLWLEM